MYADAGPFVEQVAAHGLHKTYRLAGHGLREFFTPGPQDRSPRRQASFLTNCFDSLEPTPSAVTALVACFHQAAEFVVVSEQIDQLFGDAFDMFGPAFALVTAERGILIMNYDGLAALQFDFGDKRKVSRRAL